MIFKCYFKIFFRKNEKICKINVILNYIGMQYSVRSVLCQHERKIERNGEQGSVSSNVVVSHFDGVVHMVMLRVVEHCLQRLGIAVSCFTLDGTAISFISHHKIQL